MKKIALVNLEAQYTNLALEKIRKYYKDMGAMVSDEKFPIPPMFDDYDLIFVSSIFTFTDKSCVPDDSRIIKGGTGFDVYSKLPDEIEKIKPRINIGFTTRGCFRQCKFCVVPEKEGTLKVVGDIHDIWDGKSNSITLFDNNIIGNKEHFIKICNQALAAKIRIDFNQGLDIRIMDEEMLRLHRKVSYAKTVRYAYDDPNEFELFQSKLEILNRNKIRAIFYVLVGFDTTPTEDMERLLLLKKFNQKAYVMQYKPIRSEEIAMYKEPELAYYKYYKALAVWVNMHWGMEKYTFFEFINLPGEGYKLYSKYEKEYKKLLDIK